ALREHHRQGANHLLLDPGRRACLGGVALALDGALEPSLQPGAMTRRGKAKSVVASQEPPAAEAAQRAASAAITDGQKDPRRRRRRGDGSLEERIGYRFKDAALLDSALSHISSLKGSRNRAGSYQRLEFLGDHVLGLVISDMLF